ncbi:MAG: hypothetical protein QXQ76_02950, partial [Candidatus Bathyarchaeia archaeon]
MSHQIFKYGIIALKAFDKKEHKRHDIAHSFPKSAFGGDMRRLFGSAERANGPSENWLLIADLKRCSRTRSFDFVQ